MNQSIFQKVKFFFNRHERRISSIALVTGFITDSLTLRRVDLYLENLALIFYIIVVATNIIFLNLSEKEYFRNRPLAKWHPLFLITMQFGLGALFSAFLIFYSRSSSLASSWPFLFLLLANLVGNEMLKKKYARLGVQISIFYFVLFSYLIFLVPLLLKKIGSGIFIISGLSSLILIYIYIYLLNLFVPNKVFAARRVLGLSIGLIFVVINFLYFTNRIPPIPLAAKDVGVFHSVTKSENGSYRLAYEKEDLFSFLRSYKEIHIKEGSNLYFFSAVFSPAKFSTKIVHRWQYFDQSENKWTTTNVVPLTIVGGRDGGYRTFSLKSNVKPGRWRVGIETERGQIIGRIKFRIELVNQLPDLLIKIN